MMSGRHEHSRIADDEKPLDPEQQKIVARVRWLMLISGFATLLGIAVVIGVIGYRFFRSEGSVAPARGDGDAAQGRQGDRRPRWPTTASR